MESSFSHVPVLALLPLIYPIRKVLELGSGKISTPVFTNSVIYSDLLLLDSYENGPESYIKEHVLPFVTHPNHRLIYSRQLMAELVAGVDINLYDLIFVDDSASVADRAKTIRLVTERVKKEDLLIVIHDFEQAAYKEAIQGKFNQFIFNTILPHTGLLRKTDFDTDPSVLLGCSVLMASAFSTYENDVRRWSQHFKRILWPSIGE